MPILCKWSIEGEQGEAKFNTVDEMFVHRMYNSFNYINMDKCGATSMPSYLPSELQILSFNENRIFSLPPLPATLHSLYGKNNRLSSFPDITRCLELEDIDLNGNEITSLDMDVPTNIKTIDLNFNRLMYINYDRLYPFIKVSASYNFLKVVPPDSHIQNIKFDHNDIPDKTYHRTVMLLDVVQRRPRAVAVPLPTAPAVPLPTAPVWNAYDGPAPAAPALVMPRLGAPTAPIETDRIVGTDPQSVHQTSVQQSANKSLNYVINYVPKKAQPEDLITEVINAYKTNKIKNSRMRRFMKSISRSWAESGINIPPIRKWCLANDIHSQFGVTYKSLLKQVWAIIEDHEHKEAMRDVLFQELDESVKVCFTGRFTRTLNALTGFIEEVQIGINPKEQMQNQIAMAVKKAREKLGESDFQPVARENVKKILADFEVPLLEQEAWLDAIE